MYVWLSLGFFLLIKGADLFVDGSSSVARMFKVPAVIIGLTIVAMGTSAPEIAVTVAAAVQRQNEIALSTVIGSNIFNLLVVVGVCAAIKPVAPAKEIIRRDLPISLLSTVLLLIACLNLALGRLEGIVFLLGFLLYIGYLIYAARKKPAASTEETVKKLSPIKSTLFIHWGQYAVRVGFGRADYNEHSRACLSADPQKTGQAVRRPDGTVIHRLYGLYYPEVSGQRG